MKLNRRSAVAFAIGLFAVLSATSAEAARLTVFGGDDVEAFVIGTRGSDSIALEEWVPGLCFVLDVNRAYEVCGIINLRRTRLITINLGDGHDYCVVNVNVATEITCGRGNDYVIGGPGPDSINGGPGADFLQGMEGDDFLEGGSGNDWLDVATWDGSDTRGNAAFGDGGRDIILGSPFADFISSYDEGFDEVYCFGGRDSVEADPVDRIVGCEDVFIVEEDDF